MYTPHKSFFLLGFSCLAASISASAVGLNTSDITGYVGGTYLGAETIRQSGSFNRGLLVSGQSARVAGADEDSDSDAEAPESHVDLERGIRIGGSYGDYDSDEASDRRFDSDYDVAGVSLGYVHEFDGFKLGVSLSYIDTDFNADGTDTNPNVSLDTDGDGFFFALGASKKWEKLEVLLQGGAGEISLDSTRENGSFNEKNSDYDVSLYFFSVTALYDFYQSDRFGVQPFIELGYMSLDNDSFSESDSPDTVSVNSFEDEVPYVYAGANFEYFGFDNLSPYLSLAVWADLGDDSVNIKGADPIGTSFKFDVPDAAETTYSATLGLGYTITERFEVDGSVGAFTGDDISGTYVGLAGTFTF